MERFKVKTATAEREKLESTSAQEVESVCKRKQAKTAKEYHVLKRCREFRFIEKLVPLTAVCHKNKKVDRYIERANPSGDVGRLGKRLTDLCAFTEFVDFYVAIKNTLRART